MSIEDSKRLYGRWRSEPWNGNLAAVVTVSGHDFLRVEAGRFAECWGISEQA